ncbi:MAG: glycosyltransferase family 4 protein [Candidatus Nomurabacteria bacterium]|nr:MAG: glycosyltransferase family 4 protein [Candidatus Nomurabacteria bacterium]HRV76041.1 glycosyltransferase family 1 protein [Candidatus Saccharimonadales bacterium]
MNKTKQRILIDARIIGTGTGDYAEGILNELQKLDHQNEYIIILDPATKLHVSAPNFREYRSKNTARNHMFFIRGNLNLAWEMYRLRADVFWGSFQHIPFFYFKRKTVVTVHDLTQVRIANPKSKIEKREEWKKDKKAVIKDKVRKLPFSLIPRSILMFFLNLFSFRFSVWRAKHIFTPSKYVKNDVIDYFKLKPEKVSVTVNGGVILNRLTKDESIKKLLKKDFLLYVGTDHGHKNLNILLEVMDKIRDVKPDLNLVFAGRKDRNYVTIQNRARELNLEDRVHVLGFVSDGEKGWLFKHAKLYVFPSLSEGFGIPPLEAMAYDLPVIASDKTAIPEVCGDAAVYFDPTDKDDIAKKILDTIDNEKLKKDLIKKGRERNKLFKWEDSAKVVLAELTKL